MMLALLAWHSTSEALRREKRDGQGISRGSKQLIGTLFGKLLDDQAWASSPKLHTTTSLELKTCLLTHAEEMCKL